MLSKKLDTLYTKLVQEHNKGNYEQIGCGLERFIQHKIDKALERNNLELYYNLREVKEFAENDY